jgi:hypothetical protein
MESKEAVGEDPTIEEGAQLTLDESRNGSLVDAGVAEPGLQPVLDHPIEDCRLGTARRILGSRPRRIAFAHEATVVSWSGRRQQVQDIEFPPRNRAATGGGTSFPPPPLFLQDSGGLLGTPGDWRGQRVGPQLVAPPRFDLESRASPTFLETEDRGFGSRRLHQPATQCLPLLSA